MYGKRYENKVDREMRKETFVKNYRITRNQAGSATMRINQFADWYDSEYHDLIRLKTFSDDSMTKRQGYID